MMKYMEEGEKSFWKDKFPLENRISGDHSKILKTLLLASYLQYLHQSISTIDIVILYTVLYIYYVVLGQHGCIDRISIW